MWCVLPLQAHAQALSVNLETNAKVGHWLLCGLRRRASLRASARFAVCGAVRCGAV